MLFLLYFVLLWVMPNKKYLLILILYPCIVIRYLPCSRGTKKNARCALHRCFSFSRYREGIALSKNHQKVNEKPKTKMKMSQKKSDKSLLHKLGGKGSHNICRSPRQCASVSRGQPSAPHQLQYTQSAYLHSALVTVHFRMSQDRIVLEKERD